MPFFEGASNVTANNSTFVDVAGNYISIGTQTNTNDSGNRTSNTNVTTNSNNDSSIRQEAGGLYCS